MYGLSEALADVMLLLLLTLEEDIGGWTSGVRRILDEKILDVATERMINASVTEAVGANKEKRAMDENRSLISVILRSLEEMGRIRCE